MALHTKKQFAELCGIKTGDLSNYAKRGKVVYSGDYVDDTIQPNIDFLKKAADKAPRTFTKPVAESLPIEEKEVAMVEIKHESPSAPKVEKPIFKQLLTKRVSKPKEESGSGYELGQNKLQLQIENLELKNRELEQKIDTRLGETIPKDPVVISFQYINKNMCVNIKTAIENLVTRYEKNFTPEQFAAIRTGIIKEINTAQKNAVEQSKKQIQEIIAISSTKKEVGERE